MCHEPEPGTNFRNESCSHDADVKNGVKQILDTFDVTGENPFFWRVAAEELVGRHQPVVTVRKIEKNFPPQRLALIIQNVPGSYNIQDTPDLFDELIRAEAADGIFDRMPGDD